MNVNMFNLILYGLILYTVYGNINFNSERYDLITYTNVTVRLFETMDSGPGQKLIYDPKDHTQKRFFGKTINRQMFDRQFGLDISHAIGISTTRVKVVGAERGNIHYSWENSSVLVHFLLFDINSTTTSLIPEPSLLQAIKVLTEQCQDSTSLLRSNTNITNDIDPYYGIQITSWDTSIKLNYAISVLGDVAVQNNHFINEGSLDTCDNSTEAILIPAYCEFERFFEDDISYAVNISSYRIQTLFVKSYSPNSVLMHFRILPYDDLLSSFYIGNNNNNNSSNSNSSMMNTTVYSQELSVDDVIITLTEMIRNTSSALYQGNVTVRTDSTWGLGGTYPLSRKHAPLYQYKYYEYESSRLHDTVRSTQYTAYDKCKATRRCNWGVVDYDTHTNEITYSQRLFYNGTLFPILLYMDFESWTIGTRGLTYDSATVLEDANKDITNIRGAHFNPFSAITFSYMNDTATSSGSSNTNSSTLIITSDLVYDRHIQYSDIQRLSYEMYDINHRIQWLSENKETYRIDAIRRSRRDSALYTNDIITNYTALYDYKDGWMNVLNSSWCIYDTTSCALYFNTSDVTISGLFNGNGTLQQTSNGTEVAVYTFDSIYLGPEINITIVGQRPIALVSRSSIILNTSIILLPGTVGGFQGGQSIGIYEKDILIDTPDPVYICDMTNTCSTSYQSLYNHTNSSTVIYKNINGPGSGNVLITPFTIQTSANDILEVQMIRTSGSSGQTLSGGFILKYRSFTTPLISHSVTSTELRQIIENNLNRVPPVKPPVSYDRSALSEDVIGVGQVWVTRSKVDSSGGYSWTITFLSAKSSVDMLQGISQLNGNGATLEIQRIRPMNLLGGSYNLYYKTSDIRTLRVSYDENAESLRSKLLTLPGVATAKVYRSNTIGNCHDGFCVDEPGPAGSYIWTIYVATYTDTRDKVTSITSPLSNNTMYDPPIFWVDSKGLIGINSSVKLMNGLINSPDSLAADMLTNQSFYLAYGGSGGSYGGKGGYGYTEILPGPVYNTEGISDLLGGSGGCMRGTSVYEIDSVSGVPTGRGGSGGGAIELTAANDIILGSYSFIDVSGEDGYGSTDGGGGGGSGGSVLLAAGGHIQVHGMIRATGGAGGHSSIASPDAVGGGGGGGRVAIHAQSILNNGTINITGGKCGGPLTLSSISSLNINITTVFITTLPFESDGSSRLAVNNMKHWLDPIEINLLDYTDLSYTVSDNTYMYQYLVNITMPILNNDINYTFTTIQDVLDTKNTSSDSSVAELIFYSYTIDSYENATIYRLERDYACVVDKIGQNGTVGVFPSTSATAYISNTGVENTNHAYYMTTRGDPARTQSQNTRNVYIPFNNSQPTKMTFYIKLDDSEGPYFSHSYGVLVLLTSTTTTTSSNITSITNSTNSKNTTTTTTPDNNIGVFMGESIYHGIQVNTTQEISRLMNNIAPTYTPIIMNTWTKIDIRINWKSMVYSVSANDTTIVYQSPFIADNMNLLKLLPSADVAFYIDEIYVGFDVTFGFECPLNREQGILGAYDNTLSQSTHGNIDMPYVEHHPMMRHYNFLPLQNQLALDGEGRVRHTLELSARTPDDVTLSSEQGSIPAGKFVADPIDNRLRYMYHHYVYPTVNSTDDPLYGYPLSLLGLDSVAMCSTHDGMTWQFQGIVFDSINMTDTIYGTDSLFTIQRPSVQYNSMTEQYVMWMNMDDSNHTLNMAAVAYSPYPEGPFLFLQSTYPDGNRTLDQTLSTSKSTNITTLIRSFDYTSEYILPQAISQPIWESVKHTNGSVDYRRNYHRAYYAVGYDNYHDIYLQRWRLEDKPYQIKCRNKITGIERDTPPDCIDPDETKLILGLGLPAIPSRYISPADPENSWWMPTSQVSVRSQPWYMNYKDGLCGIHALDEGYNSSDTTLDKFVPINRQNCSNIADNPPHAAYRDILLGALYVAYTRTARYIAISALTDDYMDTTGQVITYEGTIENQRGLSSLVHSLEDNLNLLITQNTSLGSTYIPPEIYRSAEQHDENWSILFHQYIETYGDRSKYSLACVVDGNCPVNYKDQIRP